MSCAINVCFIEFAYFGSHLHNVIQGGLAFFNPHVSAHFSLLHLTMRGWKI